MKNINIAYCGINCDACSVRQFGLGNTSDVFVACMGGIPKTEIKCDGCRSKSLYAGCRVCNIRHCAIERKLVHCGGVCSDFPCRQYDKWSSLMKILPHIGGAKENLETINREGVDAWQTAQQSYWSCTRCGTPFSWYSSTCGKCEERFTDKRYNIKGPSKFICRIIFPLAYKKAKRLSSR